MFIILVQNQLMKICFVDFNHVLIIGIQDLGKVGEAPLQPHWSRSSITCATLGSLSDDELS